MKRTMMYFLFVLLLVQACVAPAPANSYANKIKHVIVLMEENRSFDHMFGWFKGVNGLTGNEYNLVNVSEPNSARIYVDDKGPFVAPCDPDHGTSATLFKVYGQANASGLPQMSGFVDWEIEHGNAKTNSCMVMSSQSPSHLPILSALSSEFVLMDRFFCDYPGPTWPNRLFMLSATSAGCTATGTFYHNKPGALYPQLTFFDQLTAEGFTWKNYFNDTPWELFVETIALHPQNLASMEHFYEDAKTGNLPSFAWINPRAGINITLLQGSNDQHPDHDVALGERYYKDIYEALRASPAWNDTLFVITYDEHGGFYDHVFPPTNVPPPGDNQTSYPDQGVLFNRLGVRIPTLLISPWLPKGYVLSGPPEAQKPFSNSEYSLSSIMATARLLLGFSPVLPLTQRDAWAATFEHLFANLTSPRTDSPLHLPPPPPPAKINEEKLPVNELQKNIMEMHSNLNGVPFPEYIKEQGQVSEWLQAQYNMHVENVARWKKSKTTRTHSLALSTSLPLSPSHSTSISQSGTQTSWNLLKSESGFFLVSVRLPEGTMCLDYTQDREVGISRCFPREDAEASLDETQRWVWQAESVRPRSDQKLCLTKDSTKGLKLQQCDDVANESQKWIFSESAILSENGEKIIVV